MAAPVPKTTAHRWNFYRAGGVDQARIDTGADVLAIPELDQKLWVALSCPTKGLEFDERTLALLDTDNDGHVRAPEICNAIRWVGPLLKNADDLTKSYASVPLSVINDQNPEGKKLLASAKQILTSLGRNNAKEITVEDATQTAVIFKQARHNGDGVVPPATVDDPDARKVAEEIIACLGGLDDRSGEKGYDQARLDQFFTDLTAFSDWWKKAEGEAQKVLPLGDKTVAALGAIETVRVKIDDYFARCRLAAFDPRAQAALNREETAYLEVAAKDLSITAREVAGFPLAMIEPNKPLPLTGAINPAWAESIAIMKDLVIAPLLGKDKDKDKLTEADWLTVVGRFAPYQAWIASKAGVTVEKLGLKRVREILAGKTRDVLAKAIADDKAVAGEMDAITGVEKLVRFCRDLFVLVNNFVSFTDFYSRRRKAVFQAGTLYIDSRRCDLVVSVHDPAKHAVMAVMAKSYLAYCDCTRPGGEKMTIAAALSAGDSDNLMVGRNGLFYDRKGRDWDASVTKIVDNPIGIAQAFWAPYKKFLRWIEESIAKRAAAADQAAAGKLQAAATVPTESQPPAGKPVEPKKFDVGIIAALSIAIGAIGTAFGYLFNALLGLGPWLPLGLIGVVLAISGPSMLIAYMKLRQRNIGPILDANGWAVNSRVRINVPFGGAMTDMPKLPEGASRSLADPYAEKPSPWPRIIVALLVLAAILYGLYRTNALWHWIGKHQTPEWTWIKWEPTVEKAASKPAGG